MRIFIRILIVLGILGGAGYYYWRTRKPAAASMLELTPVQVVRGSIVQSVASTGRVVSNLDVDIKCKASGQVIKLPFDVSDTVRRGQLLVEIDPIDETRALNLAQVALDGSLAKLAQAKQNLLIAERNLPTANDRIDANLRSAESKAKDARAKANRRKELLDKNLGMQEDYDTALTTAVQAETDFEFVKIMKQELKAQELAIEVKRQDVKLAEAEVESDRIAHDNAKQRLDDTKVVAPMDGVVSDRKVQIGVIISSGITNVGGGTTVLTLSDLSRIFVLASVDESDIGRVAVGQTTNITVDAYLGMQFLGKVVRIATKGVNVSNVVTFEAKIEVTSDKKTLLKPEMTANVQIVAAERNGVLVIPSQAVTRKADQVVATISRADGTTEDRPVKVGMSDGDRTEIASGLAEGETVMYRKGEGDSKWRADQPRPPVGMMMGGPRPPGGGGGRR